MDNKLIMVALFDSVSQIFGYPIVCENDGIAKRIFCNMVKDENTIVGKNPSDFTLYCIGYFDNKTGEIFSKFDKDSDIIINGLEAQALNVKE